MEKPVELPTHIQVASLLASHLSEEIKDRYEGMSKTIYTTKNNSNWMEIKGCRMDGENLVILFQKDLEGPMRELVLKPIAWRKP